MESSPYLIDSHCHLHDPEFFNQEQQAEILKKAAKNRVRKLVCIGTSHQDSLNAKSFVDSQKFQLFWTYGIHPSELQSPKQAVDFSKFKNKPVAIGEVGLDYHYGESDRQAQIKLFEEMIDLAIQSDLPLVFHIREAFDDFFAVLDNFSSNEIRGVVHSFTDNKKNLNKSLSRNFFIGVNGLATYSTLPMPPLDHIMLETDSPFLAPVPYRGQTNDPSHIKDIASWLSQKLQVEEDEIARVTTKNTETLFRI